MSGEGVTDADADESGDGDEDDGDDSHLDGVADGCGCAEVWEHLSKHREDAED